MDLLLKYLLYCYLMEMSHMEVPKNEQEWIDFKEYIENTFSFKRFCEQENKI